MIEHWYITVAAVRQWMEICRIPPQDDGPLFDGAACTLDQLCQEARMVKAADETDTGAALYRATTRIRGRSAQIDLYVTEQPRPEGNHPQLVRVRLKRSR
jgi:hypothetical protein